VKFGYFIGQDVGPGGDPAAAVREAIAEAQAAEEAGFDGVFVSEHHGAASRYLPASIPLMYMLAAATERVDVGCAVLLLTLAQPTRVAEELALLDHVSGGRLIVGLGAGYVRDDFAAFGIDSERAGSRLEEALELVRRLWRGERVDFSGEHYRLAGASTYPPPLTEGGPPVWIGGRSRAGVRRAARTADTWVLDATPRRALFAPWHELYVEEAQRAGRPPRTAVLRDAWVEVGGSADGEYREAALAAHRAKLAAGVYAVDPEFAHRRPEDVTFDELARDRWLTGDAATIHEELDAWQAALGLEYALLRIRTRGRPRHELALEQIRVFADQVIARRSTVGPTR
jgi:alkanesulfonate monooxygenase SsuD/methylene tetrahydromethanopterin reductase-like flavin-dependent oxidoreductase (luciferase family)